MASETKRTQLKCSKPAPRVPVERLHRSHSSVAAVGRRVEKGVWTGSIDDDMTSTVTLDRHFCPPSQLRANANGLAFRPVRQKTTKSNNERDNNDTSVSTDMEKSQYDNVPTDTDDPLDERRHSATQPLIDDTALLRHKTKSTGQQSKEKRRSAGFFGGIFSQPSANDQRSRSWVWNQQDVIPKDITPQHPKKPSLDSGIGDEGGRWFGSGGRHLLSEESETAEAATTERRTPSISGDIGQPPSPPRPVVIEGEKKMLCNSPDYDSATMRAAAARNREASKKFYRHVNQQVEPGRPRRMLSKSPSQLSSSGSSSSGLGTLRSTGVDPPVYQSPPTLLEEEVAINDDELTQTVGDKNDDDWMANDMDNKDKEQRTYQHHKTQSGRDSPLHRVGSFAAASRGALKKINNKKLKAREEEQRQQLMQIHRSLPDLPSSDVIEDHRTTQPSDYTKANSYGQANVPSCHTSDSPLRPSPLVNAVAIDTATTAATAMQTPRDQATRRYGSSPSLFDSCRLTPVSTAYFGPTDNALVDMERPPKSPVKLVMTSNNSAGKPTVQVHPMPFSQPPESRHPKGDLKVTTADLSMNSTKKPAPSPRPPVPRKPDRFLITPPKETWRREEEGNENRSVSVHQLSSYFGAMTTSLHNGNSSHVLPNPPPRPSIDHMRHRDGGRWSSSVSDSSKSTLDSEASSSMSPPCARFLADLYGPGTSASMLNLHVFMTDDDLSPDDIQDLDRKREELIGSLSRKVAVLDEERTAVLDEIEMNDRIGRSVVEAFEAVGAPEPQQNKLSLHIHETAKVTSLMLKLSGQLSRVDNALQQLSTEAPRKERQLLMERKSRLTQQLDDAKMLRSSLGRRDVAVVQQLAEWLTEQQVKEFQYFMEMQVKLLIDAKEIDEKLQLGQEQLLALQRSVDCHSSEPSLCP